ncbi:LuxR C-terminal-related transcriptional regulator [Mangrovitalea sediminis]|uniref:LuxR C-terminal-related transcriptional regulator n=1 Tax=Mangrovitalea sediminis TaxID=1982043 RepID=UPI000BE55155|nr:LuxR C-terminal-related transcriptional regulator [Mangrovitalea sediminis]
MKIFPDNQAANDHIGVLGEIKAPPGELRWELLRSRWRVPALADELVPRKHLMKVFDATRAGESLLLNAPAGYGKTQAIRLWLDDAIAAGKVAWLSAEARDNDPERFVGLLAAGLLTPQQCSDHARHPLHSQLSASDRLTLALRAWQDSESPIEYLVLDNLEQFESDVVELIVQLLKELPPTLSLLMAARRQRILPLQSGTLSRQFRLLGESELALTLDETQRWFEPLQRLGVICPRRIEQVHLHSEGWIAPLALYRRALAQLGAGLGKMVELPEIGRFFEDVVLAPFAGKLSLPLSWIAEPKELSEALLQQLGWHVNDAAPGRQLAWLAAEGLPLEPVSANGQRWRLNRLLRDWLESERAEGRQERLRRLGEWLFQEGDIAAGAACLRGNIPTQHLQAMLSQEAERLLGNQDLRGLYDLFAGPVEPEDPALKLVYGWCLALSGRYREAVDLAEELHPALPLPLCARQRLLIAFSVREQGDSIRAQAIAEQVLGMASEDLSAGAKRMALLLRGGVYAGNYRFQEARDSLRAAIRLSREQGDNAGEMVCLYEQARIEVASGYLGRALSQLQAGLALASESPVNQSRIAQSRLLDAMAWLFWHRGEREAALCQVALAVDEALKVKDVAVLRGFVLKSLLARANMDLDGAMHWLDEAERHMQRWQVDDVVYLPMISLCQAMIWIDRQVPDEAAACLARLDSYPALPASELFPWLPGMAELVDIRLCIHQGDIPAALTRLTRLQQRHLSLPPLSVQALHLQLLQVLCFQKNGRPEQALITLRQAVELAATEQLVSPFAEMQTDLRGLVAKLSVAGAQREFLAFLQDQLGCAEVGATDAPGGLPVEPVSDRELGVLELIALGLSNQDIADRLHISLHTVKTHARKINAKLGVRSRTQAIVRARDLGLL